MNLHDLPDSFKDNMDVMFFRLKLFVRKYFMLHLTAFLLAALLAVCVVKQITSETTQFHQVQKGETLLAIANHYKVPLKVLREANGIPQGYDVLPNSELIIPIIQVETEAPKTNAFVAAAPSETLQSISTNKLKNHSKKFSWPVNGKIKKTYEGKNEEHHKGLLIANAAKTVIQCSRDGHVIYSGDGIPGYGKMVIVEHPGGYTTHYAHNTKNLVRAGSKVKRGQKIATVGNTGSKNYPALYFEIRLKHEAVNPLVYLP